MKKTIYVVKSQLQYYPPCISQIRMLKKSGVNVEVCCESTRAHIMRSWYGLKKLPYVMPNKPYGFDNRRRRGSTSELTVKAINLIRDKKFIIYQGILKKRDYMIEMARAIKESQTGYYFVLMGQDPEKIYPEIKKEYDKSLFIDNIPAPFHLDVTSYAHMGFVFYDENSSLNRIFCAPNKIYEYSGFGIPIIGNAIPGLISTVEKYEAGVCCAINKDNLIKAIKRIDEDYNTFSDGAKSLFEGTDNIGLIKRIIEENQLLHNKQNSFEGKL